MPRPKSTETCAVKGCTKAARAKSLCTTHYARQRRRQSLLAGAGAPLHLTTGVFARVSKARAKLLEQEAKRLGHRSRYSLASHILEKWVPPK